ncbi:spore germination protein Q [Paenibacillus sp. UNC496MF]|uniref:spore coat protein GerQ n=1 Tax=Paenibacillus sp. UNC496MF TaxID=1502753 RepID=UPI0008E8FA03|nr:spore coat protein GerQ [Paenibacillus sp. UNC496MF]SFI90517.1 spore germination protein Q [Paenibacillus sp. UNC496MF]
MSNGYGYNTAVSPASTGGFPGYGYGMPTQMPTTLPAQMPMQMSSQMPMQLPVQMPVQAQSQGMSPLVAGASAQPPMIPNGSFIAAGGGNVVGGASEESYVENILRMNRGKMATFYMTYENNREWNAKVFRGVIEAAGRDHIIISDPSTGMRYLLLTLNLDYVTFDGPINYSYTFNGVTITNNTALPSSPTTNSAPLGRP